MCPAKSPMDIILLNCGDIHRPIHGISSRGGYFLLLSRINGKVTVGPYDVIWDDWVPPPLNPIASFKSFIIQPRVPRMLVT